MLIDIRAFVAAERALWVELERCLERLATEPGAKLTVAELRRFHYLYQRAAADLTRLRGVEPELGRYLETLVGRAFSEIHEVRVRAHRLHFGVWLKRTLPQTFRRRWRAFVLASAACGAGILFGAGALLVEPSIKPDLLPFEHLQGNPADRVAEEEGTAPGGGKEEKTAAEEKPFRATFSSFLITHNTRIAVLALATGMTYGLGTIVITFYNGVILGAVAADYLAAGQGAFLFGWLLPHGVIEIPAFVIAAQAGLVLAGALIGWGKPVPLRARLRLVRDDLVTLILGVALLLVWAGVVESFLSQHHQPVIPYGLKIGFGLLELAALLFYLLRAGRTPGPEVG